MENRIRVVVATSVLAVLTGCFENESDLNKLGNGEGPPTPGQNSVPTISGSPPAHVLEGESYEFVPVASDADGDALEFSIARKPAWVSFDRSTGRLWGTPGAADVGNFTNISISVSDGQASAALAAFDVTVNQIAEGAATLSWLPPTENDDGTVLTNLAGYRIYYGRSRDNLTQLILVDNPGLTSYVIGNLTPARWFFAMTSVNSAGAESDRSETASKTIG